MTWTGIAWLYGISFLLMAFGIGLIIGLIAGLKLK